MGVSIPSAALMLGWLRPAAWKVLASCCRLSGEGPDLRVG
jgi:hypothetical protein